jgi:hypothetical protein
VVARSVFVGVAHRPLVHPLPPLPTVVLRAPEDTRVHSLCETPCFKRYSLMSDHIFLLTACCVWNENDARRPVDAALGA